MVGHFLHRSHLSSLYLYYTTHYGICQWLFCTNKLHSFIAELVILLKLAPGRTVGGAAENNKMGLAVSQAHCPPAEDAYLVVCSTDGHCFSLGIYTEGVVYIVDTILKPYTIGIESVVNTIDRIRAAGEHLRSQVIPVSVYFPFDMKMVIFQWALTMNT